jgi:hypothetical protein
MEERDVLARAYKATTYLANRLDSRELPCVHCLGKGMRLCECVFQTPTQECPFCQGTGVDPDTYVTRVYKD